MSKIYSVEVKWTCSSELPVLANSIEEAKAKAREMADHIQMEFINDFPECSNYETGEVREADEVFRKQADINEEALNEAKDN